MSRRQEDKKDSYRVTAERLRAYLARIAREHPDIWKHVDFIRSGRGKAFPDWPDWCFVPTAGAVAIVNNTKSSDVAEDRDIATIAALSAWRVTQGVYRFHPNIFSSILDTPLTGDLPTDLFFSLPEWCVYVETPGLALGHGQLHGFFCHLEREINIRRPELRFLLDCDGFLAPYALFLDKKTIQEALVAFFDAAVPASRDLEHPLDPKQKGGVVEYLKETLSPLVSLVLYLCSVNRDVRSVTSDERKPGRLRPVKTKQGPRIFAAERQSVWEVGYRIGAALEYARQIAGSQGIGSHARPMPHVRRAHWHSFWTGSRKNPDSRERVVKWLPPILVGLEDWKEIVPTFRVVK